MVHLMRPMVLQDQTPASVTCRTRPHQNPPTAFYSNPLWLPDTATDKTHCFRLTVLSLAREHRLADSSEPRCSIWRLGSHTGSTTCYHLMNRLASTSSRQS